MSTKLETQVRESSKITKIKYYIASPGFSESDLDKIKQVEDNFDSRQIEYYSPFKHGGTLSLNKDWLDKLRVKNIFDENIIAINQCNRMIAIVDWIDKGTIFEVGYFSGLYLKEFQNRYRYLNEINQGLLLLGELSNKVSELVRDLEFPISKQYLNMDFKNQVDRFTTKEELESLTLETYFKLGASFANGFPVYTESESPLDSNLMTACSTLHHRLINEESNELPGTLQPMKFASKMQ